MARYTPFVNLGPGDSIREELAHYGWGQKDLAEVLGFSEKHVSQLLNNKVPVTLDMACRLGKAFKQSPQFWLNLDAQYRLRLQESAADDQTAGRALIYRYMPVREMREKGWLPPEPEALLPAVLKFWGLTELRFDMVDQQAACFRKSDACRQFNPFYALTWLQQARNMLALRPAPVPGYDERGLNALVRRIPELTTASDGVLQFLGRLREVGVAFLNLPHVEKTYTDGASFRHGKNPALVYTARYDRLDNFWFTVVHEIGHILLHLHEDAPFFVDSLEDLDMSDAKEKEADDFASDVLHCSLILDEFAGLAHVSRLRVLGCAKRLRLHRGIVVGCLQFHQRLGYQALNDLKEPVRGQLAVAVG